MARHSELGGLDEWITREPDWRDDTEGCLWVQWCPEHGFTETRYHKPSGREECCAWNPRTGQSCRYPLTALGPFEWEPTDAQLNRELEAMGLLNEVEDNS